MQTQKVDCVAAILRNVEGCVLLQKRGDDPGVPFAGYWTLPGGKVEEEETPEAAIGRELMEEIELETSLELWKVYERPASDLVTVVQHVYVGQIGAPISRLAVNEGQALRYCTSEEIEILPIAYGFDTLLKEYLSGNVAIEKMAPEDWQAVRAIYLEGIATRNATFETDAPDWEKWDRDHMQGCRLIARKGGQVLGWAALSPVSGRCVYAGVASLSIYVAEAARGQGVGKALLQALLEASEQRGIWTLEAGIFPENATSLALHRSCGFREVGRRERIGQMDGVWRDVIFMERRSQVVGR